MVSLNLDIENATYGIGLCFGPQEIPWSSSQCLHTEWFDDERQQLSEGRAVKKQKLQEGVTEEGLLLIVEIL